MAFSPQNNSWKWSQIAGSVGYQGIIAPDGHLYLGSNTNGKVYKVDGPNYNLAAINEIADLSATSQHVLPLGIMNRRLWLAGQAPNDKTSFTGLDDGQEYSYNSTSMQFHGVDGNTGPGGIGEGTPTLPGAAWEGLPAIMSVDITYSGVPRRELALYSVGEVGGLTSLKKDKALNSQDHDDYWGPLAPFYTRAGTPTQADYPGRINYRRPLVSHRVADEGSQVGVASVGQGYHSPLFWPTSGLSLASSAILMSGPSYAPGNRVRLPCVLWTIASRLDGFSDDEYSQDSLGIFLRLWGLGYSGWNDPNPNITWCEDGAGSSIRKHQLADQVPGNKDDYQFVPREIGPNRFALEGGFTANNLGPMLQLDNLSYGSDRFLLCARPLNRSPLKRVKLLLMNINSDIPNPAGEEACEFIPHDPNDPIDPNDPAAGADFVIVGMCKDDHSNVYVATRRDTIVTSVDPLTGEEYQDLQFDAAGQCDLWWWDWNGVVEGGTTGQAYKLMGLAELPYHLTYAGEDEQGPRFLVSTYSASTYVVTVDQTQHQLERSRGLIHLQDQFTLSFKEPADSVYGPTTKKTVNLLGAGNLPTATLIAAIIEKTITMRIQLEGLYGNPPMAVKFFYSFKEPGLDWGPWQPISPIRAAGHEWGINPHEDDYIVDTNAILFDEPEPYFQLNVVFDMESSIQQKQVKVRMRANSVDPSTGLIHTVDPYISVSDEFYMDHRSDVAQAAATNTFVYEVPQWDLKVFSALPYNVPLGIPTDITIYGEDLLEDINKDPMDVPVGTSPLGIVPPPGITTIVLRRELGQVPGHNIVVPNKNNSGGSVPYWDFDSKTPQTKLQIKSLRIREPGDYHVYLIRRGNPGEGVVLIGKTASPVITVV